MPNVRQKLAWPVLCLSGVLLSLSLARGGFFYSGTAPGNVPWPGGIIPYQFDPSLTAAQTNTYLDGVREWELAANIKFIPRSNQTQYVLFKYDPLGPNQFSGANPVVVEINSLSRAQVGHETGHILGFNHENIRPDQVNYVLVLSNNVAPGQISWFVVDPTGVTNGIYDFESVMHLGRNFSSISPSLDTQQARPGYERFQPRMGNYALSIGDRVAAKFLYGPPAVPLTNIVTTTRDSGAGSLRAALYYAMDHPGTTITFNIPISDPGYSNGVFNIKLSGHLPPLVTDGTMIGGSTQPGFAGNPLIFVDGAAMLPESQVGSVSGLLIYAANCAVKNLSFARFNWNGLTLLYADATNNTIAGCWCGLDATGTNRAPNAYQGVLVSSGASRNIIGGTNALARNVLSGNSQYGFFITDTNTTGNIVLGNYVGTDATGTLAVSNTVSGAFVGNGSRSNVIGGAVAAARNVFSGNRNAGLWLTGVGTKQNVVQRNFFGLDASGSVALPNTFVGLYVVDGAASNIVSGNVFSGNGSEGLRLAATNVSGNVVQGNFCGTDASGVNAIPNGFAGLTLFAGANGNQIGGTTAAARNVLSGNGTVGLALGSDANHNTIEGNFIGTDAGGTTEVANGFAGVYLTDGARDNLFGGTAANAGNVVSGNWTYGLYVANSTTRSNLIQGNFIGTRADGSNALANGFVGVIIFDGAHDNVFGLARDGGGTGNRIAYNWSDGLRLGDVGTTNNPIRGNSFFNNGGLGINLAGGTENSSGVTANDLSDTDDGGNRLQNYPLITNAFSYPNTTTVHGALNSTASRSFLIDVYRNASADASGYGEGENYLGSTTLTTDGSGHGSFNFTTTGNFAGQYLTVTATDATTGDTSEFSLAVLATNAPVPPEFLAPFALTSTGFVAQASLTVGQSYRIQATTNLGLIPIPWVDLTNFIANATNFTFLDRAATNRPMRFYRVVSP